MKRKFPLSLLPSHPEFQNSLSFFSSQFIVCTFPPTPSQNTSPPLPVLSLCILSSLTPLDLSLSGYMPSDRRRLGSESLIAGGAKVYSTLGCAYLFSRSSFRCLLPPLVPSSAEAYLQDSPHIKISNLLNSASPPIYVAPACRFRVRQLWLLSLQS
jgi:hypothetical protein